MRSLAAASPARVAGSRRRQTWSSLDRFRARKTFCMPQTPTGADTSKRMFTFGPAPRST